jgi:ribokinase
MKFNVVTFGSATYDTYLTSDGFKLRKTDQGVMLCEMYGRKVKIEESVITTGGGATNVAVCFERLGLQSAVVACIGRDSWGRIVKEKLEEEGVSLLYLQKNKTKPTSSSVALVGKDGGRTILVYRAASSLLSWKDVDWDRLGGDWAYITSLGGDFTMLTKIIRWAQEKNIKLAINPGSGELKESKKLAKLLPAFSILILNKQEALKLHHKSKDEQVDNNWFFNCGAEKVVITDGDKGAIVLTSDKQKFSQKSVAVEAVEVTGAGDAFGSSFVAGQINGLSLGKSLQLAALNSASVVKHIGPKKGLMFWPEVCKKLSI